MLRALLAAVALAVGTTAPVLAQDFYDPTVLRTVELDFQDTNWWPLLQQNYQSQTNILADLTVEGVTYPDVGVRIRGNTSYAALPPGSQKVSLNIETDFVHADQEVMGYRNLNFNNAFTDPTFCREVVYMNVLAKWIPSGRANHVVVELNGENWGVYANVQQFDKTMLRDFFEDEDGLRIKMPNNPNGPGLQYQGPTAGSYSQYEVKDDGGFANPIGQLIQLCEAVDTFNPTNWPLIDRYCAVDPSIWTVVLENLFADDDSYINKGADFVLYQNPIDGRSHILQTDGNETFKHANWALDYKFNSGSKPFLNNVLSNPELRQRYVAHMRSVLHELDWANLGPVVAAHRQLIDAAVQADPKKLYSYNQFVNNFTSSVNIGGFPPFGGTILGLEQFANQRHALLANHVEVLASPPAVASAIASTDQPGTTVTLRALVNAPVDPVAAVRLYYLETPSSNWRRVPMFDDGLHNDGAAGDRVYGADLPFVGAPGQRVPYYVEAISANAFGTASYFPERAEMAPSVLEFDVPPTNSDIVVNEVMAQNQSGVQDGTGSFEDWFELYNRGTATIDLSGMYLTDSIDQPTAWQIPAGVTLAPGEFAFFWADDDTAEGANHTSFKLSASGEVVALFDTDGTTLVTSFEFGQQTPDVSTGPLLDGTLGDYSLFTPTPDGPNLPASGVVRYGERDAGAYPLSLDPGGTAAIGTPLTLDIEGVAPFAPAFIAWGLLPTHVPTPNGIQLVQPVEVLGAVLADGGGDVSWSALIPNAPALVGVPLFLQAGVVNGSSLDLTNGVVAVVGP